MGREHDDVNDCQADKHLLVGNSNWENYPQVISVAHPRPFPVVGNRHHQVPWLLLIPQMSTLLIDSNVKMTDQSDDM